MDLQPVKPRGGATAGEGLKLSRDRHRLRIDETLAVEIPPEALGHEVGGRSTLEWAVDRLRAQGVAADAARAVRLIGQVVRAAVETIQVVRNLPAEYA